MSVQVATTWGRLVARQPLPTGDRLDPDEPTRLQQNDTDHRAHRIVVGEPPLQHRHVRRCRELRLEASGWQLQVPIGQTVHRAEMGQALSRSPKGRALSPA